jgi:hypothetical protein
MTLWWLGEDIEEAFDRQWEEWLDQADAWAPFFDQITGITSPEPFACLTDLDLVRSAEIEAAKHLQVDPSGHSVKIDGGANVAGLLALGFAKGSEGKLVVPYAVSASWG